MTLRAPNYRQNKSTPVPRARALSKSSEKITADLHEQARISHVSTLARSSPDDGDDQTSASTNAAFLDDAIAGLRATPKRLSPKYFYDREGSLLFDAICELPEYYVTRTELSILEEHVDAIASRLATPSSLSSSPSPIPIRVVEPGAGSGTKTRLLLHALGPDRCVEYVPVDIAGEHLEHTATALRAEIPWLRVTPFAADFSVDLAVPPANGTRTVIYFPGSTIGNFDPGDAKRLLARFRRAAGANGLVLIGVDLKKDPTELHAAYNDAQGITAAFNKNVMRRMNDELGADFDLDAYHHYAFYDPGSGRIEMHLVSARQQEVTLGGESFTFEEGESICTEHSYKYDLATAARFGHAVGLSLADAWLDRDKRFAVLLFQVS